VGEERAVMCKGINLISREVTFMEKNPEDWTILDHPSEEVA
jgi:hypothetical protein